jgi:Mn-dependent DtxR family transcriptional regulator
LKPITVELFKELQKLGYIQYENNKNYGKSKRKRYIVHDDSRKDNILDEYFKIVGHL